MFFFGGRIPISRFRSARNSFWLPFCSFPSNFGLLEPSFGHIKGLNDHFVGTKGDMTRQLASVDPIMVQNWPYFGLKQRSKQRQNDTQTTRDRCQNEPLILHSTSQNTVKKRKISVKTAAGRNGRKSPENDPILVPKWPFIAPDRVEICSKRVEKDQKCPKNGS